ncbi:metallophosphoesterase [filamentous cyanobacterium LEGE 11480]|uniref:Metallophosphoesterase n=1 Tax=Romeriopsis navalis LEGE 11480 TaxID=2777977 RepID=A0A928VTV0_9CYAN|nr:metallophosphoesterase [Romeriopsis navalis]MBE9031959.1 metallophosphoesterase [Romeriopsis navalis LEGE 11480]
MQRLRRFKKSWKAVIIGFFTVFTLFYIGIIEPNWIEVRPISLTLPHLAPEFEGYKIVQLTDIHADKWMSPDRLSHVLQIANQQNPDLVAMTGDYVTRAVEKYAPTLSVFEQLTPKDGTLAVLGNHDNYSNPYTLIDIMHQAGVKVLWNEVQEIQRGDVTLAIAGSGDVISGHDRLPHIMARMPLAGAGILLVHEPDFADKAAATHRFDLQLSGHSHGGQIKLPFVAVRRITPKLAKKYPSGLYKVDDLWQYTSRGVGLASRVRVRLNCRPEVTVLTLHAPPQAA